MSTFKKRAISVLATTLTAALLLALLPLTTGSVYADEGDSGMEQGYSLLTKNAGDTGLQKVWYGDRAWYVIAADDTASTATLLQVEVKEKTQFNADDRQTYSNAYGWMDSDAETPQTPSNLRSFIESRYVTGYQDGENTVAPYISEQEQLAIVPRTLEGGSGNYYYDADYDSNKIRGKEVKDAYVWPLSVAEAEVLPESVRTTGGYWWLRSPGTRTDLVAEVNSYGRVDEDGLPEGDSDFVRPAFYLNLESVLFTSAAEGGKSCTEGALTQIGTNTNNEWKVTLIDEDRNFSAKAVSEIVDNSIDIEYSSKSSEGSAIYGTNEYISAVIENSDGNITYYGRLKNVVAESDAEGTLTVKLPEGWSDADTLYLFSEQYNGDKLTDYASTLQEITVPEAVTLTFDLCGGTLDGKTGSITVNAVVGQKINLPGAPTKEGYTFKCWKGSEYAAGAEYTVDGPHDFTAEWEEVKEEQETKQDTSPKTGDHNKAGLWAAIMGGALLVVIAAIVADRKYLKKQR